MRQMGLVFLLLLATLACSQKKSAQDYFNEGAKCFEKGEFDRAIEFYNKGIAQAPGSAVGYNLLGMAYRFKFNQSGKKDWRDKEIESFKKSIELEPDFVPALVNLGATFYYSGDKKKAVPYFKHALEVMPNHPEAEQLKKMIAEGSEE